MTTHITTAQLVAICAIVTLIVVGLALLFTETALTVAQGLGLIAIALAALALVRPTRP